MYTHVKLVHVIFKTHLDVGFTDYAYRVVSRYLNEFIPGAIALARQMEADHPHEPFCWTIGSWLLKEYLEQANEIQRQEAEAAIAAGHLVWHALPFTTHTELMDADLFRAGLQLSQDLDARFGHQTIASKMTDVPGHTRAIVPLLAEAGVKLLHVGVNPAATVPDVPPVFVWHDQATDARLLMIYQNVYGESMALPGTDEALALVFTGDNLGPPSLESVRETYVRLREEFPNAEFVGSSLDAVARSLLSVQSELPVVTAEIGDTWIHGTGSDPGKVSRYRELLRLRQQWIDTGHTNREQLAAFDRQLMLIPEHTWGMDLKTHLQDYEHYDTEALARMRKTPRFQQFEASWEEQRAYIDSALAALTDNLRAEAEQALTNIQPERSIPDGYLPTDHLSLEDERWQVQFDPKSGAISYLKDKTSDAVWADDRLLLALFQYETFSTDDYERYWQQYIRDREFGSIRTWAHPDNVKPGLQVKAHQSWYPQIDEVYSCRTDKAEKLLFKASFADEARRIGAPGRVSLEYILRPESIAVRLQWFDKPACRLPEAFWMRFAPILEHAENWHMDKMGQWISPLDVISGGSRTMHAVNSGVRWQHAGQQLYIESLDAPLVAPGQTSLLDFHNRLPDLSGGVHFNLFNNVWGTNFTMWYDEDALFRFNIRIGNAGH